MQCSIPRQPGLGALSRTRFLGDCNQPLHLMVSTLGLPSPRKNWLLRSVLTTSLSTVNCTWRQKSFCSSGLMDSLQTPATARGSQDRNGIATMNKKPHFSLSLQRKTIAVLSFLSTWKTDRQLCPGQGIVCPRGLLEGASWVRNRMTRCARCNKHFRSIRLCSALPLGTQHTRTAHSGLIVS